jgi:hypothetical protein
LLSNNLYFTTGGIELDFHYRMSGGGGKKKKNGNGGSGGKKKNANSPSNKRVDSVDDTELDWSEEKPETDVFDNFANNAGVDVLDRLAPPILFFPPNVSEEYLNRFCPGGHVVSTVDQASSSSSKEQAKQRQQRPLLAEEGFPDREIPVMRRLLAMMAGIMSKASAASARAYYSRVAGSEGRRNGLFQQNLNTSVFNLFSTLSAAGAGDNPSANAHNNTSSDLHLNPAAAFTAKDGEPLRGYSSRLMKFWRQLSTTEQVRLVKEEHAALTNCWIESRQTWCLCAHCKHRRMTISDLTDCLYQTYCEELEAFIASNGQGSTLYSPALTNSTDPAAKARRFLFKSLSVVGEQALLPRYNQFILKLEAFSSMAFSPHDGTSPPTTAERAKIKIPGLKSGLKSAALQASKEFLLRHGKNASAVDDEAANGFLIDPEYLRQLSKSFDSNCNITPLAFDHNRNDDDDDDCILIDRNIQTIPDSDDEEENDPHQGGIQSEDDDDLIDEETDLPIDESELMLPGGASFPLLPVGEGPVQWSESSRIECGRTVFLMFASEMFQYRLTTAYLDHQTRQQQLLLIAEIEAEEQQEKALHAKLEREKKERANAEKRKKAAKKEKAAAKSLGSKTKQKQKPVTEKKQDTQPELEPVVVVIDTEPIVIEDTEPVVVAEEMAKIIEPAIIKDIEPAVAKDTEPVVAKDIEPEVIKDIEPSDIVVDRDIEQLKAEATVIDNINNTNDQTELPPHEFPSTPNHVDDDDFDPNLLVELLAKEMNQFEAAASNTIIPPPGFSEAPPGFTPVEPKHLENTTTNTHFSHPPFFDHRTTDTRLFSSFSSESVNSFDSRFDGHSNSSVNSNIHNVNSIVHDNNNVNYKHYEQYQQQQQQQQQQQHHHLQQQQYQLPPQHLQQQQYQHQQQHQRPRNDYSQQFQNDYSQQISHPQGFHSQYENYSHMPTSPQYSSPPPSSGFYPPHSSPSLQKEEPEPMEGQSRFQSFFSKSIFGPSTFFKQ